MKIIPQAAIVSLIAWASTFIAVWRCWVYNLWLPMGWLVILFSLIVAIISGGFSMIESRDNGKEIGQSVTKSK